MDTPGVTCDVELLNRPQLTTARAHLHAVTEWQTRSAPPDAAATEQATTALRELEQALATFVGDVHRSPGVVWLRTPNGHWVAGRNEAAVRAAVDQVDRQLVTTGRRVVIVVVGDPGNTAGKERALTSDVWLELLRGRQVTRVSVLTLDNESERDDPPGTFSGLLAGSLETAGTRLESAVVVDSPRPLVTAMPRLADLTELSGDRWVAGLFAGIPGQLGRHLLLLNRVAGLNGCAMWALSADTVLVEVGSGRYASIRLSGDETSDAITATPLPPFAFIANGVEHAAPGTEFAIPAALMRDVPDAVIQIGAAIARFVADRVADPGTLTLTRSASPASRCSVSGRPTTTGESSGRRTPPSATRWARRSTPRRRNVNSVARSCGSCS